MSMENNQELLSVQVSLTDTERFVVRVKLIAFLLKLVFKEQKSPYMSSQVSAARFEVYVEKERYRMFNIYLAMRSFIFLFSSSRGLGAKQRKGRY